MNLNLDAVYFCATNANRWGKGTSIAKAKKNAGITRLNTTKFYVQAAVFDNPTPEELANLHDCISANELDGSAKFYDKERTEADDKMINEKLVGWLTVEKNY